MAEPRKQMTSGSIGNFDWVEIPTQETDIRAVVQHLSTVVVGLVGVNVSWDSGYMIPTAEETSNGWRQVGEHAVSPAIDATLVRDWPMSTCLGGRFDEWYFFRAIPEPLRLEAFCNYGGFSVGDAHELGAFQLEAQLDHYRPEIVIGDGLNVFVISSRRDVMELMRAWPAAQRG